jgi:hypothetical protein
MIDSEEIKELSNIIMNAIPGDANAVAVQMALVRLYILNAVALDWEEPRILGCVVIGLEAYDHRDDDPVIDSGPSN